MVQGVPVISTKKRTPAAEAHRQPARNGLLPGTCRLITHAASKRQEASTLTFMLCLPPACYCASVQHQSYMANPSASRFLRPWLSESTPEIYRPASQATTRFREPVKLSTIGSACCRNKSLCTHAALQCSALQQRQGWSEADIHEIHQVL